MQTALITNGQLLQLPGPPHEKQLCFATDILQARKSLRSALFRDPKLKTAPPTANLNRDVSSYDSVQQFAFTSWANYFLKDRDLCITDLTVDLSDGVLLINLLEVLSVTKLPRFNAHPKLRIQRLSNLNVALNFLKEAKLNLVNIGAGDIERGNMKIVLGLLWTLILHYQIKPAEQRQPSACELRSIKSPQSDLLDFVNKQISPYNVNNVSNFTSDFSSGVVLSALTDSLSPGIIKVAENTDPLTRIETAVATAEREFGIPVVIAPVDIVKSPQEHSMMTYVSFFLRHIQEQEHRRVLFPPGQLPKFLIGDRVLVSMPHDVPSVGSVKDYMGMGRYFIEYPDGTSDLMVSEADLALFKEDQEQSEEIKEEKEHTLNLSGFRMAPMDPTKKSYEITVGCTHLVKTAWKGKADPCVGLFEKDADGNLLLVDTTECIPGEHDPVFQNTLTVHYDSSTDQQKEFRVIVWDARGTEKKDGSKKILQPTDQDMIGYADVWLSRVIEQSDDINTQGMVYCMLRSPNSKQEKKLKQRNTSVNLSLQHRGLRQAVFNTVPKSRTRKGDKFHVRVTLTGYQGKNPLVAVFDGNTLLSQTEFVLNARSESVTFSKQLLLYIDTSQADWQERKLRFCVYGVGSLDKKELRNRQRVVVPVCEDHLLGIRDVTVREITQFLKSGRRGIDLDTLFPTDKDSLTHEDHLKKRRRSSLRRSSLQTCGSLSLRGFLEPEMHEVSFVNVLEPEPASKSSSFEAELEVGFACSNLFALDFTDACDPVLAFFESSRDGDWAMVGHTEWVKSEHHPTFAETMRVAGPMQTQNRSYRVNVYDVDMPKLAENKQMMGCSAAVPVVSALDSNLAAEKQLVGVAYFTWEQLLKHALTGKDLSLNLSFPTAKIGQTDAKDVAEDWYKIKRLADKKSTVTITSKVITSHISSHASPSA
jgi:hypothetical protein